MLQGRSYGHVRACVRVCVHILFVCATTPVVGGSGYTIFFLYNTLLLVLLVLLMLLVLPMLLVLVLAMVMLLMMVMVMVLMVLVLL